MQKKHYEKLFKFAIRNSQFAIRNSQFALLVCILFTLSCKKNVDLIKNQNIKLENNVTLNSKEPTSDIIILGEKFENPLSVYYMKLALLKLKTDYTPQFRKFFFKSSLNPLK